MCFRRPEDFDHARDTAHAHDRVVREAKTIAFRQAVHDVSSAADVWGLVRWARGKPRGHTEKVSAFKERFHPSTSAQLGDIPDRDKLFQRSQFNPIPNPTPSLPLTALVTLEEIRQALLSKKAFSAPGWDSVPYHFLRALGKPFAISVQAITQACWDLGHNPKSF
ncbi:hypothetical protein K3495_g9777 [Podosphaera aphanis]|nr:hypothetical protein K3495_g9777 [Podosphaera aphanis]